MSKPHGFRIMKIQQCLNFSHNAIEEVTCKKDGTVVLGYIVLRGSINHFHVNACLFGSVSVTVLFR